MVAGSFVTTPFRRHALFALGWMLYVASLAAVSSHLADLSPGVLGLAVWMLAVPPVLGLWHHGAVRRRVLASRFKRGTRLHAWTHRRGLAMLGQAVVGLLLSWVMVFQAAWFGAADWCVVGLSPCLYLGLKWLAVHHTQKQFARRLYAQQWALKLTDGACVALLLVVWLAVLASTSEPATAAYLDRVYQWQRLSDGAQSSVVKWMLDAGAYGQAAQEQIGSVESLGYWAAAGWWLAAPLAFCRALALALAGLSMSGRELGAAVSTVVGGTPQAPSARSTRTAVSVAVGVLFSLGHGLGVATVNESLARGDSPLALQAIPACESIDGVTYRVHTLSALNQWLARATTANSGPSGSACTAVDRLQAVLATRVDRYLDGYFSLGGDYARLAMGLTGNLEGFLQTTFHSTVWQGLEGEGTLAEWQAAHQAQWGQIQSVRRGMEQVLKDNRLLLEGDRCRVVASASWQPLVAGLEATHARLAGAAVAGLSAGVLASALTAKVMAKASFQLSAKVLAKTLAAKAGGHAAGAMTGATVGAGVGSGLPVIGTAVGAAVGAVAGVVVGAGVDVAALALQEKLTRADMRADLMAAVGQTLQPLRDAFGCHR